MKNLKENNTEATMKAVGFIKSRKSDDKIMNMAAAMYKVAGELDVDMLEVIVDPGVSADIDRESIDELYSYIENKDVDVVFIQSMASITNDADDFVKFLYFLDAHDMLIVDMEQGARPLIPIYK